MNATVIPANPGFFLVYESLGGELQYESPIIAWEVTNTRVLPIPASPCQWPEAQVEFRG